MADSKRFLLRLDPRLFEVLRRWADEDLRSINGQIEYLLTDQARRAGRLPHRQKRAHPADTRTLDDEDAGTLDDEDAGPTDPGEVSAAAPASSAGTA